MARENKSKYAILGLLARGPMSGYDIKKSIEIGLGNFWSESYGQIYPVMNALADEGLTTRDIQKNDGKPDRHVYTITDKGREVLHKWLTESTEPLKLRVEVLLKLFFGKNVSLEESLKQVESFRQEHIEKLKHYLAIEEYLKQDRADNPEQPYWLMTVSCGIWVSRAFVDWCDETIEKLKVMVETPNNQ